MVLAKKKHADLFNEFRRLTWHSSESSSHEVHVGDKMMKRQESF